MPMTLSSYLADTQTFLADAKQDLLDPEDIIKYINRARREIALRTQCIRVLTPITGAVIGGSVVSGGSAYSSTPTITLTPPDFPSGAGPFPNGSQGGTITAIVSGGSITGINVGYGGAGYWQPSFSITDATGRGASITPVINTSTFSQINQLNQGQEVYNFSQANLADFPGVQSIYAIQSVSLLYSGFRYSLLCYSFSTYQALIRIWAQQWQYVPCVCAQYGQGVNGSFYMYPIPSQPYQMEWDCYCLPQDLLTDLSVEAIPDPWTDAVAYWAAHLCYLSLQNFNAAKFYEDMFSKRCLTYSNAARVSRQVNPYGRYSGGF
jgi:hypothetical protein